MSKLSGKTVGAYAGLTHHARVVINYSMFVIYLAAWLILFNDMDGFLFVNGGR